VEKVENNVVSIAHTSSNVPAEAVKEIVQRLHLDWLDGAQVPIRHKEKWEEEITKYHQSQNLRETEEEIYAQCGKAKLAAKLARQRKQEQLQAKLAQVQAELAGGTNVPIPTQATLEHYSTVLQQNSGSGDGWQRSGNGNSQQSKNNFKRRNL
jgi:uncharacterized protein YciW